MKNILVSLFLCLFLVGCLDYTQYVSMDDNNNINVIAIVTVSKSMIDLAAMSEGYENGVPDYYYDEILSDMEKEFKNNYPRNFKFKKINNDNEIGLYINGVIKEANLTEDYSYILPIKEGNKFIFTPFDNSEDTGEYNEYASMFSSMKMKLIVSKTYIPTISACYISSYDDVKNINVYDFKDSFLIEMPIIAEMPDSILYIES